MADAEKNTNPVHLEKADSELSAPRDEDNAAEQDRDWTPEEEKKLKRKVDLRFFPMLCIVFGLSLLDRANISAAYIAGLGEDLRLDIGTRYSIALLVFFIPYALFELPSNMIIRRVGARFWMAFLITTWGACVLGMGFVHDWKVLTVLRTFLGMFEAGLFPGSIFLIGCWYRQFETAKRISIFYMAAMICSGFGSIFAYALSLIRVGDGMFAQGWRWIFIIEGAVTVAAGLVAPFFLIEFPEKAKFLNEREKTIARERILCERQNKEVVHPNIKQTLAMLVDWKLLVYALQYFIAASCVYSLAFFSPIILMDGMGFDYTKAQLLSSPPYLFAIVCSISTAWLSDKIQMRWPILCSQYVVGIVGLLVVLYAKPAGGRYVGLFLATYGAQANVPATLTFGQNQTARIEKKGVVAAVMIGAGAAGGICGSTIFRSQDAPTYYPGMWTTICLELLHIAITFTLSRYFKRQNRLADEGKRPALEGVEGFRYAP